MLDGGQQYWLRVWAARALLYAWDDMARGAVLGALADEAWRVREIAAKVVARRLLGEALAAVAELRQDEPDRARALRILGAAKSDIRRVLDHRRRRCRVAGMWLSGIPRTGDCGGEGVPRPRDAWDSDARGASTGCLVVQEALAVASWEVLAGHAPARGVTGSVGRYGGGTAGKYRNRPGRGRTGVDVGGR